MALKDAITDCILARGREAALKHVCVCVVGGEGGREMGGDMLRREISKNSIRYTSKTSNYVDTHVCLEKSKLKNEIRAVTVFQSLQYDQNSITKVI